MSCLCTGADPYEGPYELPGSQRPSPAKGAAGGRRSGATVATLPSKSPGKRLAAAAAVAQGEVELADLASPSKRLRSSSRRR